MENLSLTVKGIKAKLLELVKKHQLTLEQLEQEKKRVEELQQEIADLRGELNELNDKNCWTIDRWQQSRNEVEIKRTCTGSR